MNKCQECLVDPVFSPPTKDKFCVYCPSCEKRTDFFTLISKAIEEWDNGKTTSKEESTKLWEATNKDKNATKKKCWYVPPKAAINLENKNLPPPYPEYEKNMMILNREEVQKVTKSKEDK